MKNKNTKIDEIMLYRSFIFVDDACQALKNYTESHWLSRENTPKKKPKLPALSESEIILILVYYHYLGYKNFEYYYKQFVFDRLKKLLPQSSFVQLFFDLTKSGGLNFGYFDANFM